MCLFWLGVEGDLKMGSSHISISVSDSDSNTKPTSFTEQLQKRPNLLERTKYRPTARTRWVPRDTGPTGESETGEPPNSASGDLAIQALVSTHVTYHLPDTTRLGLPVRTAAPARPLWHHPN